MSDVQTDVKKATGISTEAIAALRMKIRGDIIQPGDPQYNTARRVYNAMIDKHPALIVRCVDAADVSSAVEFGNERGLDVAVRGGSHNGPGFGTVDGGLVIDLSRMRSVRVDPEQKTVRVEGGAIWGDVDHATHSFSLAVPCGLISTTGVGGLTLGGGTGYLTRRYGLTIDNLLSVDMVLADGCFVTANMEQNEDLFWAVRGGGGNFGVVTSFLFKAHPVDTVYGGGMYWPMEAAGEILLFWQDLILNGPDDLNGWFGLVTVPPVAAFPKEHHLKKMCTITWCYTGPLENAEQVFKPIRAHHIPTIDLTKPLPLATLNSMGDALSPAGYQWYWQADFFTHYDNKTINLLIEHGKELPTMYSKFQINPSNGAAGRFAPSDTAWYYRNAPFAQVIVAVDPDPTNNGRMIKWAKDYWSALHPHSMGGAYLNQKMDEGQETIRAAYGKNYARLAQIKAKYDPNNFFHINQNILPKA